MVEAHKDVVGIYNAPDSMCNVFTDYLTDFKVHPVLFNNLVVVTPTNN